MGMARRALLLLLVLALAGCAAAQRRAPDPRDPLEPINRAVFSFNDGFDRHFMRPVARGYKAITPDPVEQGVRNFFANLGDVRNLLNDLLQLKPTEALDDFGRLTINSTFGLLGVFDIATDVGLERNDEDFGQTLGYWGVPDGPYLVLPILGPSSLRDAPSLYVDYRTSPQTYAVHRQWLSNTLWALNFTSVRAELLGVSAVLDDVAFDRYQSLRDAWFERRAFQVSDGASAKSQDEELMDELDRLD